MPDPISQENLPVVAGAALGDDAFRVLRVVGEEGLSRPFHFAVELESDDPDVDFGSLLGEPASVSIAVPGTEDRLLHGIVTRFVQEPADPAVTRYRAELRPWIWLLTLSTDSRIFQELTVPEILETVFSDHGFSDFRFDLDASYDRREYCVQYEETAFDFVSRLMEEEGLFFLFEHTADAHILVVGDDPDAYPDGPGWRDLRFGYSTSAGQAVDILQDCSYEEEVTPQAYSVSDFDFQAPSTDLLATAEGDDARFGRFRYPEGHTTVDDGEARADLRLEAEVAEGKRLSGESRCRSMVAGHTFELSQHIRGELNREYVVRSLRFVVTQEEYHNTFEALPTEVPFRPGLRTPRPTIPGVQTARVVGKEGEEIWTDEYGRIKVQFHWDRRGNSDEDSSCWVRVSQGWAGQGWGHFFLPRVGQEVVVTFLSGDPDRPLVTGGVYNAEQSPPYPLPDEQTKSTIRSQSTNDTGGFNELRFEDKDGEEEIYLHAQQDMNEVVENDHTEEVGGDRTTSITGSRSTTVLEGNEELTVEEGNRTVAVSKGDEIHSVEGERAVQVEGDETHGNSSNFTHDVEGDFTLNVSGSITISASGDVTIESGGSISVQASGSLSNEAGTSLSNQAGTSLTNSAGTTMTNEADVKMESKGGASHDVTSDGIVQVQGNLVKLN